jgi:hypothetical protein
VPAPSRLTRALIERIAQVIRGGGTLELAAHMVDVHPRTILKWLERGDPDRTTKRDMLHRELRAAVERAREERKGILVSQVGRAASQGSWRAASWLLEREFPEDYADDRGGARPGIDHDDAFAIIDDQIGPDGRPL